MERLQREFVGARFVKAFNSVGNTCMVNPQFKGGEPTMFICGNDDAAKKTVSPSLPPQPQMPKCGDQHFAQGIERA